MKLPSIDHLFPRNTPGAVAWFWVRYWFWFFVLLPALLLHQLVLTAVQTVVLALTWNRSFTLLNGRLRLMFLNHWRAVPATVIWGERFLAVRYGQLLIDPGPRCAAAAMDRHLAAVSNQNINQIVATHWHEEHIGNIPAIARRHAWPVLGSALTLAAIRHPQGLSWPRRTLMGQPLGADVGLQLQVIGTTIGDGERELQVIDAPGHCEGHVAMYDPVDKVLILGDAFLHIAHTSPNGDVRSDRWIRTLERFAQLDVRTMVGGHGCVYTSDDRLRRTPFVVQHVDPNALIREKLQFLRWAREAVMEGERRGLSYRVIEASLFPWGSAWTKQNWFRDEASRLLSAGEFSRTHFVRSLSRHPRQVPPRFPFWSRLAERCTWRRTLAA